MYDTDILQPIKNEDIPKLRNIYQKILPRACYVYNYLSTVIKWKNDYPDNNCITLLVPQDNWQNGTFVGIHEFFCYEVIVFTLEENCKTLYDAVHNTKRIHWNKNPLFYALNINFYRPILNIIENKSYKIENFTKFDTWWISKENAFHFDTSCSLDVCITKLSTEHAELINLDWPYKFVNSEKYVATLIEKNGGYGIFLKSNNKLVAWVLRNMFGLGLLQTLPGYERRGYADLAIRALSKRLVEEGLDPIGIVRRHNVASENLFKKLGFAVTETVTFLNCVKT